MAEPILEVREVTKLFGSVIALSGVSLQVSGEVTCLLGDNGAASRLIKISAVHRPTEELYFQGERVTFGCPATRSPAASPGVPGPVADPADVHLAELFRGRAGTQGGPCAL